MNAHVWKDNGWQIQQIEASQSVSEPMYLVPGLVDAHCHGAFGLDVMRGESRQIGKTLRQHGVEWFCPTTVTASWDSLETVLNGIQIGEDGIAGVHLEGPFINPKKIGAQPKEFACGPSWEQFQSHLKQHLNKIKIVTLAPELGGADEVVRMLHQNGIIASIGHSDAGFECLERFRGFGLNRMTHFYNAMSGFHHRGAGCVGFGLLRAPRCELIYDRVHVSREAAELLFRSVGIENVIGISDGTAMSGIPDGQPREMWGRQVVNKNGTPRLADGSLCGSGATLLMVFQNLWNDFGPEAAIKACSQNPRAELGLPEPDLFLLVDSQARLLELRSGNLEPKPV